MAVVWRALYHGGERRQGQIRKTKASGLIALSDHDKFLQILHQFITKFIAKQQWAWTYKWWVLSINSSKFNFRCVTHRSIICSTSGLSLVHSHASVYRAIPCMSIFKLLVFFYALAASKTTPLPKNSVMIFYSAWTLIQLSIRRAKKSFIRFGAGHEPPIFLMKHTDSPIFAQCLSWVSSCNQGDFLPNRACAPKSGNAQAFIGALCQKKQFFSVFVVFHNSIWI